MKKFLNVLFNCVLIVLIATCIFSMCFFTTDVASGSMEDTVQISDILLIKRSFLCKTIKRGDICVFQSPEKEDMLLLKRVIGLPGEKVVIKGNDVYINDELLNEPYVSSESSGDYTFYVPDNSYLFLGDNRNTSSDARYWTNPYIERQYIKGVAVLRVNPNLGKIG